MPEITSLREYRGRARVFVDGEFWAEIDAGVAAERGVYEGATLSEEELQVARVAGERDLAMSRALSFLGYRARSEREVRDRLQRYGYAGETVVNVVGRLKDLGYIDDAEFARTAAREKSRRYGPRRVSFELSHSGVEDRTVQEAVEEAFASRSEHEAAHEAAARRYNMDQGSDAQSRRVYGFLMRRGYAADVCADVAREYRGESPQEAGE